MTASHREPCTSWRRWDSASALTQFHRFDGLRACAHGISLELRWPDHPVYPPYGYVVRRRDLDQMVAAHAVAAGAVLREGCEAVAPLLDGGLVRGAIVNDKTTGQRDEIRARYVVIADGANSRFGRALGTTRNRAFPQGMAIRGYYESPLHAEPWIESALDVRDRNGNSLPGYGWIFPVGDGTINVGIGLLSTFRDWKSVNTSHLMDEFAATAPEYWGISPEASTGPSDRWSPADGRIGVADRRTRRGWSSATLPEPSTRSTAKASTTPTRPGTPPRRFWTRRSRQATVSRSRSTHGCSRRSTAFTSRWHGCSPR